MLVVLGGSHSTAAGFVPPREPGLFGSDHQRMKMGHLTLQKTRPSREGEGVLHPWNCRDQVPGLW